MRKSLAFTGHRPQNLQSDQIPWIREQLKKVVRKALDREFIRFISGGARGVDTWAAEAVLELRSYHDIWLCLAIPYDSQAAQWSKQDQERYSWLKSQADEIVVLHPNPTSFNQSKQYLHARNHWMCQQADAIVSVWNGAPSGGTAACTRYAQSLGLPVLHLNPVDQTEV